MARKLLLGIALVLTLGACATPLTQADPIPMQISFLTRDGCANSPVMRKRLDAAVEALGVHTAVTVVDVTELDAEDPLTGYGTPTVLVSGLELFGVPTPRPASPT